ncbi:MAG: ACP S-malonyltransferase [Acidobacteriota bacterium]
MTAPPVGESGRVGPGGAGGVLGLFPGLAASVPGMGRRWSSSAAANRTFDAFSASSGLDVRWLACDAPGEVLRLDRNREVATVATEMAAAAAYAEGGGRLDAVLGFSIGAYAALAGAGVISVEQIVAMIDAVLGGCLSLDGSFAMAAVIGLPHDLVEAECRRGGVEMAARLAAGQTLVAGPAREMDAFRAALEGKALRVVALDVRWPLHTSHMAPAARGLEAIREKLGALRAPAVPVYSLYHGSAIGSAREAWELLVGHLCHEQRLDVALSACRSAGLTRFVELGPGETLSRAARWMLRGASSASDAAAL